jgi:Mg/Co/Ni transporter MgtE
VGSVNHANVREYLLEEMKMAVTMASLLGVAGCIRAAAFLVPARETFAITTSLWLIVFFSIVLGSLLPLAMKHVNIDPAHSSTTIQVLMDILGVVSCALESAKVTVHRQCE